MTALQKPQGGMRGIVVGDFIRWVVARTLAQQLGPAVEQHTSPFQFALSTKSGCECVAHIAQAMTDLDPTTTLLSVDGILMVRYGFIKIRMKVVTFIKNHFHQKPLSKTTFIKNHFHQKPLSSKSTFIKIHFHQNPLSSKSTFIKIHFHQNPLSSKTTLKP